MNENGEDLAKRALIARKLRDTALVLPVLGIFLFLTPMPAIFREHGSGIPAIFVYIYGVWLALILVCAYISPRIDEGEKAERSADPSADPPQ